MEIKRAFKLGSSVVVTLPGKYLARLNILPKDYVLVTLKEKSINISKLTVAGNTRRTKNHGQEEAGGKL